MKQRSLYIAAALFLSLLAIAPSAWQTRAQTAAPSFAYDQISNENNKNEFPRVALGNSNLYTTWKSGTPPSSSRSAFSFRNESSTTSPAQQDFGGLGQGSYQTSSVGVSPIDGSVHLVWAETSGVYYARVQPNGTPGTGIKISSSGTFPHFPHMTVDKQGRIWAVWSAEEPKGSDNIFYRYSADGGATWLPSGGDGLIEGNESKTPWITADQTGGVHVVYWNAKPDYDIRYATWDGSKWVKQTVRSTGTSAEPSITVDPSNNMHVVWRQQRGFGLFSVYYATKPVGSGSWTTSNLYDGDNINKTVVIYADSSGGLHVTWEEINHYDIFYTYKPAGGTWLSPVAKVTNDSRVQANPDLVVSSETGLVHIVYEDWTSSGNVVNIRHARALVAAPAGPVATPQLPARVKSSPVSVSFTDVQRAPTEMRWRWGAPPTDAATDSGGWVPFANPKSIALPALGNSCQALTLYTQVRNATATQSGAKTATTTFDNAVQANVEVLNPHLGTLPATFARIADNSTTNASDGDPTYTREPYAFLRIADAGDCSGLVNFTVPTGNPSPPPGFTNGRYQGTVPLPQTVIHNGGGTASISVVISDGAGNLNPTFNRDIIYDPADTATVGGGLPVVSGGAVAADNGNSVIRTLSFSGVNVSDNVYGKKEGLPAGRQFWGAWIANSRTDVGATNASLQWFPVQVPSPGSSFTLRWSVFAGLNQGLSTSATGDYFVYVRFLDGAGNPSLASTALKVKVTLAPGFTFEKLALPLVRK